MMIEAKLGNPSRQVDEINIFLLLALLILQIYI